MRSYFIKFSQSSLVYINYSLKYAIQDLHNLGYDGIEIWGGRPHMYKQDFDKHINEIINLLNRLNMKVSNFIPAQYRYPSILCSSNEVVRKESVNYIKEAIDNAIKVGSLSVSLCPSMVLLDKDLKLGWDQLIKSFKEVEEYTEDKNLVLLIEPSHKYETNLILTIEQCLSMIKVLKSEKFGILLDTGHANIDGENLYEAILKCKGIPLHIHLDDNKGDFNTHMVPGTGNIEFKPMFKALKKIEYCGFITIELGGNYILGPTSACRKSLQFVKGLI